MTTTDLISFSEFCRAYQQRTEHKLEGYLPSSDSTPARLHQAMRYSVLKGGKRLRPLIVYATGLLFDSSPDQLDLPAAAIELIHCYSLVHDDLPAMDNDDLRRGRPSCHKAFDEATAILVGDALQNLAFELLSRPTPSVSSQQQIKMMQVLTAASGSEGMAGGQMLDLEAAGKTPDQEAIKTIHLLKTGELITASFQLGAIAAGCIDPLTLNILKDFGQTIGLAFQIQDDILDLEGETVTLGKPAGSDAAQGKATYPAAMGLDAAKKRAEDLYSKALGLLKTLPQNTSRLAELSAWMVKRST